MARILSIVGWKRLAVTGLCLVAWRALEQIPVSSLNPSVIKLRLYGLEPSTFLHAIGSATPLAGYSIAAMGLQPYVYALMVITLIRVISARVRTIARRPDGMRRLRLWTRALTILLGMGQAYGWT
ncbi:MAG TPA: hypothetical protein VN940_02635, partial [Candidatus Dormibacteraeota bacterium]|nr:hypothetical protein [Candidatus Dormibacteraeota bacterium]